MRTADPRPRPLRTTVFACVLLALIAIDSAATVLGFDHPYASPAALIARTAACLLAGYFATRTAADVAITALLVFIAAFLSLAVSDAVTLFAHPPIARGFSGVGPLIARVAVPVAASAAGSILALVLGTSGEPGRD